MIAVGTLPTEVGAQPTAIDGQNDAGWPVTDCSSLSVVALRRSEGTKGQHFFGGGGLADSPDQSG